MLSALLYLRLTSLKNLLGSRLRRLRQPKYFIGAAVAVAYFYYFFFRHADTTFAPMTQGGFETLPGDLPPLLLTLASVALFTVMIGLWVVPSGKPGLSFTETEIAFLFPAPLPRTSLIHYKLLSALFSTLFQSLLYALIFNSRRLLTGDAFFIIVSWWALLTLINLHYQASSLSIARLVDAGVHQGRRRAAVLTVVALVAGVAAWSIWDVLRDVSFATDFTHWIPAALNQGLPRWLFAPFQLVLRPFFARDLAAFAQSLWPVLLLIAVHYRWAVRMNVAFEEASIAKAERTGARLARARRDGPLHAAVPTAGRRAPFELARAPWPELAFLWKNLLSTRSWLTARAWLIAFAVIFGASLAARLWLGNEYWKFGAMLATAGMITVAIAVLYGPLLLRLDLRQDLPNADILKTYPLAGWRILLGELLTPIAVLTGVVWLGLLAWYLGLKGHQPPALSTVWLSADMRLVLALCGAVLTPLVIAIELLVPNATPIVFPGWFQAVRTPGGGLDLMGQRLIFGFAQVAIVLFSLLPAVGMGALLIFIAYGLFSLSPLLTVPLATIFIIAVLIGEFWCGLWLVGERFEKLDVSSEPRP